MSYRDKNRKQIKLPSGATCWIRRLVGNDFITIGSIPAFRADHSPNHKPTEKEEADAIKWSTGLNRIIFTRCISGFECEGEKLKIVDKPFNTASPGELEIECMDQQDATEILSQVMEFSGMKRKEAAGDGQTFQPDEGRHGEPSPAGNDLPVSADTVP